jgi:hypothetical protein
MLLADNVDNVKDATELAEAKEEESEERAAAAAQTPPPTAQVEQRAPQRRMVDLLPGTK